MTIPVAYRDRTELLDTGCIVWTSYLNPAGYGQTSGGRLAHRVIWEEVRGPIPAGMELDHLCSTTACVNPEHLEPVTGAENKRRRAAKRTTCPRGHPYSHRTREGWRACRTCHRDSSRRSHGYKGGIRGEDRTECVAGHPFDDENTYITPDGRRNCRTCRREAQRRFDAKKRLKTAA